MKHWLVLFFVLFSASLARADIYLCKFGHLDGKDQAYSWKFSRIVFKTYKTVLSDKTGDIGVYIYHSYAENIVTLIRTEEQMHLSFYKPQTEKPVQSLVVDEGRLLNANSPNNWQVNCDTLFN